MSMRVERASLEQVVHLSLVLDLQLEVIILFLSYVVADPNSCHTLAPFGTASGCAESSL